MGRSDDSESCQIRFADFVAALAAAQERFAGRRIASGGFDRGNATLQRLDGFLSPPDVLCGLFESAFHGHLQEIASQDLQLQLNAWGIALDQGRKKQTPPGTSAGRGR